MVRGRKTVGLPFALILGSVAQLVEQLALNQLVVGSSPTRPTILLRKLCSEELVTQVANIDFNRFYTKLF